VVHAFVQAMRELEEEGGVEARYVRYRENHLTLVEGMRKLGFRCLLPDEHQSPIITSFLSPQHPLFSFARFYQALKARGFVIYPGKVTSADTFRIGNIGDLYPEDMRCLIDAVQDCMFWDHSPSDWCSSGSSVRA
jgi:2-aminoethylphosphonate-pyruvate transaminase